MDVRLNTTLYCTMTLINKILFGKVANSDTIGGIDECAKQGGDLFSYTALYVLFNRLHDTLDDFMEAGKAR